MNNRDKMAPAGDEPRLRLDIHLKLNGLGLQEGPLAQFSQFARIADDASPGERMIELAGKIYHSRRLRERYLHPSLLGEPVWDMMLALYCFSGHGKALSVSGLCYSAGVPQSTALRWVQVMEQKRLIRRSKDHSDGRRWLISMTDEGKKLMDDYLNQLQGPGE